MQKRQLLQALAALALAATTTPAAQAQTTRIKVGVTAGPHAQVMEAVKKVAVRNGLDIQIVEFSDYVQPNAALAAGDLDANSYQHKPYLDQQVADRGYKLVAVAPTVMPPLAVYSKKVKSLDALKNGARVGIPNDPSNEGRALLLLQAQGLIKLNPKAGLKATPLDVVENPKNIRFVEMDAAQLPRSLEDLDASTVNANYALAAGLNPVRDGIAREDAKSSQYINILAVREQDKNKPWVAALIRSFHSPEVKKYVEDEFKGSLIPSW
ncbi:MAG: MetQ/NlpA family ABC transporter substrate-binding protein [Burkholderiaceae bacterium]|jgi:D-methionine transport system substrate-binding protein|nr:MetQ/NlpA family ABC transporter substrate-binding protein [Burkholderiaceae bacterium]